LRTIVAALAVICALTFVSDFLQATPYNFLSYVFFSLLCIGGIGLMSGTVKSTQSRATKGFLFLTGISAALLLIFFVGCEWFRLQGDQDLEASIEALLCFLTLFFWGRSHWKPGLDQETIVLADSLIRSVFSGTAKLLRQP